MFRMVELMGDISVEIGCDKLRKDQKVVDISNYFRGHMIPPLGST